MNFENEYIQKIYERIYATDIFNECIDINLVNWNEFFLEASHYGIFKALLESVDQINNQTPTKDGHEDSYKIVTKDSKEYIININYINNKTAKLFTFEGERYSKNDKPSVDFYKNLNVNITHNGKLCFIEFHDAQNNHTLTGTVGISAHELFSGLREAAHDSITKNITDLKGIVIRIFNNELDRILPLYKRILINSLKDNFPNIHIDSNIEKDKGITLLLATV